MEAIIEDNLKKRAGKIGHLDICDHIIPTETMHRLEQIIK